MYSNVVSWIATVIANVQSHWMPSQHRKGSIVSDGQAWRLEDEGSLPIQTQWKRKAKKNNWKKVKLMDTIGLLVQTYDIHKLLSVVNCVVELSTTSSRKQGDHFRVVNTLLPAVYNKLSTWTGFLRQFSIINIF